MAPGAAGRAAMRPGRRRRDCRRYAGLATGSTDLIPAPERLRQVGFRAAIGSGRASPRRTDCAAGQARQ